ncbi:FAD-binding oxidoreductase [Nonomuraea gerenzanensis]|uniref:FAD linked oxidase domain protein n=1 Tax=Nonomuraea gerenzanensis TaxID=93944 RepID=A0A1M4EB48_9ACTN|nr:FAD-binding oxidoreductase [Nonomuraea gerenzanensis]UBU18109.1 FAD-binding oxidoreductase [Nonomuraea gerenzanensis]SBO95918.1 FAD linked oxidase domain protein [Nonomuraea gerenzanensis]
MTHTDLRATVRGLVLLPGDDAFEQAAKPWNLSVHQPAAAVVEAEDAADVAAVVRYAARNGLTVTAQPSGHGASGDTDGVILLRTGRLGGVTVRREERVARVGAGVQWGEVLAETGPLGLTGLAGSSPVVSVTGYTLGGGLSWFGRRYGFAADSVRSFDVVSADGEPATVTASSDPDLFWALRGGGGDFALVTAIEFGLHPAPALYGGRMMWPGHRTHEVFEAFREITEAAPDELSVWFNRFQFPQAPPMVAVDAAFLGEEGDGRALLARLDKIGDVLADKRGTLPVAALGAITDEPTDPAPGRSRAELLTGLDDTAAKALLDTPLEPVLAVQVRHVGGALAAARPDAGPSGPMTEPYLLYLLGLALNPDLSAAVGERQERFAADLGALVSGRKPYTMLGRGERAAAAFAEPDLERLREIKRARDPHGVLRANFPVLG